MLRRLVLGVVLVKLLLRQLECCLHFCFHRLWHSSFLFNVFDYFSHFLLILLNHASNRRLKLVLKLRLLVRIEFVVRLFMHYLERRRLLQLNSEGRATLVVFVGSHGRAFLNWFSGH